MAHTRVTARAFGASETIIDALMLAQCYTDSLVVLMHVIGGSPNVEVTNKPSVPLAQEPGYGRVALGRPAFSQVQAQLSVSNEHRRCTN